MTATTTGAVALGAAPHRWVSEPLDVAGEAVAAWVDARLAEVEPRLPRGDRVALHVASPDGGAREALAFWRAAHVTGFALAAPGAFPWTLSNSVTGRISLALGITGPCTTWVGGAEAAAEAELGARLDLDDGLVDAALVVTVAGTQTPDAEGTPVRVELTASLLTHQATGTPATPGPPEPVGEPAPSGE